MDSAPASAAKTVDLGRVGLPRLLFALLHRRFTGVMRINVSGAPQRTVWFRGGMPVAADWRPDSSSLESALLATGGVREHHVEAARGQSPGVSEERLVAALQEMGVLKPSKLREAERQLVFEALTAVFELRHGQADVSAEDHDRGANALAVNVLQAIAEGVARHYDEDRIAKEMGELVHAGLVATAAFERYRKHFAFPKTDAVALRVLTAGTDLVTLVEHHHVPKVRAHQLVYTLWACQMLRGQQAANEASPGEAGSVAGDSSDVAQAPQADRERPQSPSGADSSTVEAPVPSPLASGAQAEFEAALGAYERKLAEGVDAFALLGVPRDAGKREVRRAWSELSVQFHPDALACAGLAHLRERVSAVFAGLSEAHQILSDAEQRQHLRTKLERGDSGSDAAAVAHAALQGEMIAKEADKLLRAQKFELAVERYREAVRLNPDEPDIEAAIVWCEYNLGPRDQRAAMAADRKFAKILEQAPNIARAQYFRGFVLRDMGAIDGAIAAFERALASDRRLLDAERQARALRMQKKNQPSKATGKPATQSRGQGLKGLFGRK